MWSEAEMKDHNEMKEPFGDAHPNAAGLDIGAREIWACVPEDRDAEWVRRFGTSTPDLHHLADWLKFGEIGANTVIHKTGSTRLDVK